VKKILIIGAGKTGKAAVDFLEKKGKEFVIYDDKVQYVGPYSTVKIQEIDWENIESIMLSPGVVNWPKIHPVIEMSQRYPIGIFSDLDMLYHNNPSSYFLGITGSQGKTTTHDFLYKFLSKTDNQWVMGGNNGIPVLSLPQGGKKYLLEVSMQQSVINKSILFDMMIFTNFFDTHQEVGNFHYRFFSKFKPLLRSNFKRQKFIIGDFPKGLIQQLENDLDPQHSIILLSYNYHIPEDCAKFKNYLYIGKDNDSYYFQYEIHGIKASIAIDSSIAYNLIAVENFAFAFVVAHLLEIDTSVLLQSIREYTIIKDRISLVKTFTNMNDAVIQYFNCSKCTNIIAFNTVAEYIQNKIKNSENIFLIGGVLNSSVNNLVHPLLFKAHAIYLYGNSQEEIGNFLQGKGFPKERIFFFTNMKESTKAVKEYSAKITVNCNVFLTPCCQSFDEFQDFQERGVVFTELVN
jgi:UDP-N-acetylmuramoylalanine--D-glutamate ligase